MIDGDQGMVLEKARKIHISLGQEHMDRIQKRPSSSPSQMQSSHDIMTSMDIIENHSHQFLTQTLP